MRTTPDRAVHRLTRALPTALALTAVAAVWACGAVWSFEEQTRFAASCGFTLPQLLPLVLDGLALSLAALAYAAALDGRAAVLARLGTVVAVGASAASNGAWAWTRTDTGGGVDLETVILAAGVPVAANLAFEVLLSELRRQVQRRRGMPAPVPIPWPRLIRWVLSPWATMRQWRRLVLELTALHVHDPGIVHGARPGDALHVHDKPSGHARIGAILVHEDAHEDAPPSSARTDADATPDAPGDAVAARRASRSAGTDARSTRDLVLAERARHPEETGAQLATRLGVHPTTVTRHLRALREEVA